MDTRIPYMVTASRHVHILHVRADADILGYKMLSLSLEADVHFHKAFLIYPFQFPTDLFSCHFPLFFSLANPDGSHRLPSEGLLIMQEGKSPNKFAQPCKMWKCFPKCTFSHHSVKLILYVDAQRWFWAYSIHVIHNRLMNILMQTLW